MSTVHSRFDAAAHQQVTAAVQAAEQKTSAEIVPVIAAASGRYDRAEDLAGVWLGLILLAIVWWTFPVSGAGENSWATISPGWHLLACLMAVLAGFLVGAALASRCAMLRLLMTPPQQMQEEVEQRARSVFFDQRIHHTPGSSGVLIYLSLYEHRAVILTDQQVQARLGQEKLEQLCQELITNLKQQDIPTALCQTILHLGEELTEALPPQGKTANELADALIVLD